MSDQWTNWSGNQHEEDCRLYRPHDVERLVRSITEARAEGRTIRVVGTGHAWAKLIPGGTGEKMAIVSLEDWADDVRVDWRDNTATVPCGMTLDVVTDKLERLGLQLRSPPVYEKMSIGGLLGTASHGTGQRDTETMSDHVVGFRMIRADGREIVVDKDKPQTRGDAELLRAVRCSMGALGVVYEVTLRVEPAYYVEEIDTLEPLQDTIDRFKDLYEQNEFVELFWMPFTEKMWVKRYNPHPRVYYGVLNRLWNWLKKWGMTFFQKWFYPSILRFSRVLPPITPLMSRVFGSMIPTGRRTVTANQAFHFQQAIPRIVAQAFVMRLSDADQVWRYLLARIDDEKRAGRFPVNVMVEGRFIKRSQEIRGDKYVPAVLLSPAVFDDTAYVELVSYPYDENSRRFFSELERGIMDNFPEARPHWGKWFERGKFPELEKRDPRIASLAARFNENEYSGQAHWRMARFKRIAKLHDPDGVMSNAFMREQVLLGPDEPPADRPELRYKDQELMGNG